MNLTSHKNPHIPFALELHSSNPTRLAAYYKHLLGIKFTLTTYPFLRYFAQLGQFALMITECSPNDPRNASEPGAVTLTLLSALASKDPAEGYFLYPHRPLAGCYPARCADRLRDPDGHYIALASELDYLHVELPTVSTWRELGCALRKFAALQFSNGGLSARNLVNRVRDTFEFRRDTVNVTERDFGGYTHIMASRQGIFAINEHGFKKLVCGRFFGVTVRNGNFYCFQLCDETGTNSGRIVHLKTERNRIVDTEVLVKGLHKGCHQIDFAGDVLFIVDCCNARILSLAPGAKECKAYYPLGSVPAAEAEEIHMNSMCGHPDGTFWIMLHNYNSRHSEILVVDSSFTVLRRFQLSAGSAHNIVFTGDELEYLVADSFGGRILSGRGPVIEALPMMPRGISLDHNTCVFGESVFATRVRRRYVPGRVHFADRRSWKVLSTLEVPAAPTDIRRIDGEDFSLTNYVREQARWRVPDGSFSSDVRSLGVS